MDKTRAVAFAERLKNEHQLDQQSGVDRVEAYLYNRDASNDYGYTVRIWTTIGEPLDVMPSGSGYVLVADATAAPKLPAALVDEVLAVLRSRLAAEPPRPEPEREVIVGSIVDALTEVASYLRRAADGLAEIRDRLVIEGLR